MYLSPQTRQLRELFDENDIPYATDDSEVEEEYGGSIEHVERTGTETGFALHAWTKDEDGVKRFRSDLGKFSDYIEVDIGECREVLTVQEAFEALSGRRE